MLNSPAENPRTKLVMRAAALLLACGGVATAASAQDFNQPAGEWAKVADLTQVPVLAMPAIDFAEVAAVEAAEASENKPMRFAMPETVAVTPATHGLWEEVAGGKYWVWRLRVTNENAKHINFGFLGYQLPEGARLLIYPTFDQPEFRAFTAGDNADHGQLWTPVTSGNDVMLEILAPAEVVGDVHLDLGAVNLGYRGFGSGDAVAGKSGSCNVDVVCDDGIGWEDEISSVGAYSLNGFFTCSGALINNTENREYFLTADHCGVGTGNDQTMVIYWNYQNSTCRTPGSSASGGNGNGSLAQFNSGTVFRAGAGSSDFTIVEMEEPIDPSYMIAKAGWDRSGDEAATAVAIHHPAVEEKRISFEFQPTTTTNYLSDSPNGNGTHVRVDDWDTGTTEGGSSGSPLFDQNQRIIGQLHGGFAACGNNDPDWYGRTSVSWGLGMQQVLAPSDPGLMMMDTDGDFVPSGMRLTPRDDIAASGPVGGPFVGSSQTYTLSNASETDPITYTVSTNAGWLSVTNGSGTLAPLAETDVTVSVNASANALSAGGYAGTIFFTNTTDGEGNTTLDASLDVGKIVYSGSGFSIPDSNSISRTITIPDDIEIADIAIDLDISHTYVGDLIATISRSGAQYELFNRPGTTGSGFGSSADIGGLYTFSDDGTQRWENLTSFPPGVYLPEDSLSPLVGTSAQGTWTITISDNAGADTGSVSTWGVVIVPADTGSCPGDVADDFGFAGGDGQVSFGDFLFALNILGPCP